MILNSFQRCVLDEMRPDGLWFFVLLDGQDQEDSDVVEEAWRAFDEDEEPSELRVLFRLSSALEFMMNMNELCHSDGEMAIASKPKFDALRKELEAMLEKINGLKFA
mgnify:CR=1 FL=1